LGQKVNPIGLRLGIVKTWESRWYAGKKKYSEYIFEDYNIRTFLKKDFPILEFQKLKLKGLPSAYVSGSLLQGLESLSVKKELKSKI